MIRVDLEIELPSRSTIVAARDQTRCHAAKISGQPARRLLGSAGRMTRRSCIVLNARRPRGPALTTGAIASEAADTADLDEAPLALSRFGACRKRKRASGPVHESAKASRTKLQHRSRLTPTRPLIPVNPRTKRKCSTMESGSSPASFAKSSCQINISAASRPAPHPRLLMCDEEFPPSFASPDSQRHPDKSANGAQQTLAFGGWEETHTEIAGPVALEASAAAQLLTPPHADCGIESFVALTAKSGLFAVLVRASPFGELVFWPGPLCACPAVGPKTPSVLLYGTG